MAIGVTCGEKGGKRKEKEEKREGRREGKGGVFIFFNLEFWLNAVGGLLVQSHH